MCTLSDSPYITNYTILFLMPSAEYYDPRQNIPGVSAAINAFNGYSPSERAGIIDLLISVGTAGLSGVFFSPLKGAIQKAIQGGLREADVVNILAGNEKQNNYYGGNKQTSYKGDAVNAKVWLDKNGKNYLCGLPRMGFKKSKYPAPNGKFRYYRPVNSTTPTKFNPADFGLGGGQQNKAPVNYSPPLNPIQNTGEELRRALLEQYGFKAYLTGECFNRKTWIEENNARRDWENAGKPIPNWLYNGFGTPGWGAIVAQVNDAYAKYKWLIWMINDQSGLPEGSPAWVDWFNQYIGSGDWESDYQEQFRS